ncbi:Adenine DNA glycosylase [Methylophilaceae bacterium]|nr:Adenine DNA glycosylase [Methylophilaceae bacterium]
MNDFAARLIAWQAVHGRHDLPWQNTRDPYAIWVSEIMLQQTQVAAVIGYYRKFMQRFPDVAALAASGQDEVLQHWSGLGYYSRARNLHQAAQMVVDEHGGIFPRDFEAIQRLPGIGRSTAAAISSFAFDLPQPILDGNVKRVFARHFLVEGWPGMPRTEKRLWTLAEQLMPQQEMVAYTQGLMDLGATLCTRSKPGCEICPLRQTCGAFLNQRVKELPSPKPRKPLPEKAITMLLLVDGDEVLLEKRPSSGIWGGLWSLPEVADGGDAQTAARERYGAETDMLPALPVFTHVFTHFRLHITPQPMRIIRHLPEARQLSAVWLSRQEAIGAALPTPIRKILKNLPD